MRDNVFWRKQTSIIMMLAKTLDITPERALDIFYKTETCRLLSNPRTGLQLMSDAYVLEEVMSELRNMTSASCNPSVRQSDNDEMKDVCG